MPIASLAICWRPSRFRNDPSAAGAAAVISHLQEKRKARLRCWTPLSISADHRLELGYPELLEPALCLCGADMGRCRTRRVRHRFLSAAQARPARDGACLAGGTHTL